MNKYLRIGIWSLLVSGFLIVGISVYAANIDGYAWSENIGWIKMQGANYGVEYNIGSGDFSGYAWSENIGWIRFNSEWAEVLSASNVNGWDGLISLRGSNFGVNYIEDSVQGCYLDGWAWGSDIVGWVQFTGNRFTTSVFPCNETPEEIAPSVVSCSLVANPNQLIRPRNDTTLIWTCQNAESCSIAGVGSVNAVNGSVDVQVDTTQSFALDCSNSISTFSTSVEVRVLQPTYCEIIPYGPGCE